MGCPRFIPVILLLGACRSPSTAAPAGSAPASARSAPAAGSGAPVAVPDSRPPAPQPGPAARAVPDAATAEPPGCGELACRVFPSPRAALEHVLGRAPRVLAVGESHAQQGSEGIPSATRRFTEQFLPVLKGRANHLVLELWLAQGRCGRAEQQVEQRQRPVTQTQAASNQGEFLELGRTAQRLGIRPHALEPSCDEYAKILAAGPDDIAAMLELIATRSQELIQELLQQSPPDPAGLIVAYGGAMHNDVAPRAGREAWSFGPALQQATGQRYVELDLVVPEFVKETEIWRALPWYDAYRAAAQATSPDATLLFEPAPSSFVLVFPRSPTAPAR